MVSSAVPPVQAMGRALHLPSHASVFLQRATQWRESVAGPKRHSSSEKILVLMVAYSFHGTVTPKSPLKRIFVCSAKAEGAGDRRTKPKHFK